MKLQYLSFLFIIFTISACTRGTSHNTSAIDTLAYTYQTIKQRASDCGNKPDSGCTVITIKYPAFSKDSILNDSIKNKLYNLFWADSTSMGMDTDLQKYAQNFISVYESNKNNPDVKGKIFTIKSHAQVLRQDSSLTTLEVGGYIFEGGAHGHTLSFFVNWNTKAGKNIELADILKKGYQDSLNKAAESIFRKNEKLTDSASLAQDYFFKDNKFALNNNFLITPIGIRFLYNQYEIKPYAAGQTNLLIPYAKIKSLLLPHTVVSQYIK